MTKYMEGLFANVGNTAKPNTATTEVDARVKTGLMAICSFEGKELSPDGNRRCKHFRQHSQTIKPICSCFRTDIKGVCDYA